MAALTEKQVRALLAQRVQQAGSQMTLARGDHSLQVAISNVLHGKRPVTMPKILDLLGLEIVFRKKPRAAR
jgi:hypothetical protein